MSNWLFILFWVGALADAWTTRLGISSGVAREANPVVRWILNRLPGDSEAEYFAVKVIGFAILATTVPTTGSGMWVWVAAALLQLGLAYNNYRIYVAGQGR